MIFKQTVFTCNGAELIHLLRALVITSNENESKLSLNELKGSTQVSILIISIVSLSALARIHTTAAN